GDARVARLAVIGDRRRLQLPSRIVEGVEVERRIEAAAYLRDGADIDAAVSAKQEVGHALAEAIAQGLRAELQPGRALGIGDGTRIMLAAEAALASAGRERL